MNDDFRKRVFTPVLLPLGLTGAIAVVAWSLSRVFLAVPKTAATFAALVIAAYVLGVGAMIGRMKEVTGRALGVGLAIGLVGIVGAGAVANAVGPREFHSPGEDHGDEDGGGEEEPDDGGTEIPADAFVFTAVDIAYSEAPETVASGTVTFALINEGNIVHNVVIEELGDENVVEAQGGETVLGEVTLEAGQTYTYYCSIPGHRATMEGQFTAE